MSTNKEAWGSRVGLILAMAGNAVGLGNFLRFPVQAIQNGGGAFIIPYLVCFLLMGLPLLFVEWAMGRYGGKNGHHSTPFILDSMDKRSFWKYIGVFGIFTNLAVAAYYCYLESWTIAYVYHMLVGSFQGQNQDEVAGFFNHYLSFEGFENVIVWLLCLFLNTWILSKGLSGGVEKVAKIGMPLLILFGILLAIRGFTLSAGENGAIYDGTVGLNFLWTPQFDTIWDGKVWLAAAGQIFFTLSVGMGSIHCYASYVKSKDDIALNSMSAGWMNEFVEVVLGSAILIPIAVGYLGIDKVIEMTASGGLGLGFKTLPYLFTQWGPILAALAGVFWFGLLFFAGITSSLAMGTPCMGFMMDEFGWKREKAAWAFGFTILILGLPTVLFFHHGVFDEYDYWAGTVSLVIFALFEIILFAWVFGMDKGWKEITDGADIKVPNVFKFIIKFITPILLGWVFVKSLPDIWDTISNKKLYDKIAATTDTVQIAAIQESIMYVNASRFVLLGIFVGVSILVFIAYKKRIREGRFTS
ncbi:MAG TPA: sodium-dependent transporter [bacterium]|nr:sodium-dependent transporter [bacterium]HMZ03549.1 sodium-dependent transporter [bacterium]HNB09377.1 sodium-dependent transporter [bacterium]HND76114.1 sodium-dependent transporter [bacterium]HNH32219.1 sodium-dependent transporter [bacterium]